MTHPTLVSLSHFTPSGYDGLFTVMPDLKAGQLSAQCPQSVLTAGWLDLPDRAPRRRPSLPTNVAVGVHRAVVGTG